MFLLRFRRRFFFRELEIYSPFEQVHPVDDDAHGVAQAERSVTPLTHQRVAGFVVDVVVVLDRFDVDEAFHEEVLELDEEAEGRDA